MLGLGVTMDAGVWMEVREDEEEILDMVHELLWYKDKEEGEEYLFVQWQDTTSYGSWLYIYTHTYTHIGHIFTLI